VQNLSQSRKTFLSRCAYLCAVGALDGQKCKTCGAKGMRPIRSAPRVVHRNSAPAWNAMINVRWFPPAFFFEKPKAKHIMMQEPEQTKLQHICVPKGVSLQTGAGHRDFWFPSRAEWQSGTGAVVPTPDQRGCCQQWPLLSITGYVSVCSSVLDF
jgi:hypothetical protein